jgi:PAS domain S-box-containing protein
MQAQLPPKEIARLQALEACGLLDTPPEELFDRIARLAAYLCGTPIGLIGFIDATRQWFKARTGWEYAEIPRKYSFCDQIILHPELLVIPDAAEDERFFNSPMATRVGIRFYAGVPLLDQSGNALGTLSVMDRLPRALPLEHKDALLTLAHLIEREFPVRRTTVASAARVNDKVNAHESLVLDISQHKRSDEALKHSEERLLGIISSAMDAIVTVDNDHRIVVFNQAAEQIFRCSAIEAIGTNIDRFIPERFRERHAKHIRSFGQTGVSSRSMESPGTLMGLRADGEGFPIEASISQLRTASETLYTVILRDISVRKRTEDELRQAQKMEAVGHLAGGIAHEFNNYLGIILGYSDLMANEEVQNDVLRQGLAEIKGATQKAASLTRQLLAFSRKQLIEPTIMDLNASVWDGHKLLRRLIRANIDLIPVLHPNLGKVKADPAQIQQILINLVVNARDAMPQGGKITIETSEVVLDKEFAKHHFDVVPGEYVTLSVGDTGEGIDAETLAHIFEPFFTTKEANKGTGLGLSTTYGIVKQSGGHITVESVPGSGTTFHIYFPKLADSCDSHEKLSSSKIATILLVEDEPGLRKLMRATLERQAYRVLEAEDGAEGLLICKDSLAQIDLVVTDLAMPKMTGLQLKEKVVALRANMKFLLISGYLEEATGGSEPIANVGDFLQKPFLPDEFVNKVRDILGRVKGDQEEPNLPNNFSESRSHEPNTGTS